jgi:DNA polymerase III alpha subunit (gram-positive type)
VRYNDYHKHTHQSNLRTLDCIVKPQEYIDRAVELGHTTYFTTEHGWGGNVWDAYSKCQEKGLKMVFGVEAYYVDDRFVKDRGNYHIILIAKNREGFKDINRIISEANTSGFYYKPRIDKDLLLSLNPLNVYVTSACFLKGSKVATLMGLKNIEDIQCGDFVLNMYGEWEKVNFPTTRFYDGTGYNFKLYGQEEQINCTENHKFLVMSNNEKEPHWKEAKDIVCVHGIKKDIMLYPVNYIYSNNNIINKEEWENSYIIHKKNRRYSLSDKIIITPELMRLFGLFLGDGCISLKKNPRISFSFNYKEYEYYYKLLEKVDQLQSEIAQLKAEKDSLNEKLSLANAITEDTTDSRTELLKLSNENAHLKSENDKYIQLKFEYKGLKANQIQVRCKDCKFHHVESYGEQWCGQFDGGIGTDENGYCSFGVRKDDNQ